LENYLKSSSLLSDAIGNTVDILGFDKRSAEEISATLKKVSDGGIATSLELRASHSNGEYFDFAATISPIDDADGKRNGASVVLRDITVQKDARFQIQEQVRLRDHFLAVLSHELRNPTAAIVNASAILARTDAHKDQKRKANEIIFRHSQQLAKMMDDLLNVARVAHNKIHLDPQPVDLVAAAKQVVECIEAMVTEKEQILSLEFPSEPLFVVADETRIIQAQTNLLVNASKYTPTGGRIEYSITVEGDEVVVKVSDNGDGISEELLGKIFNVFVQADQTLDRSNGGMGLGLPLVRMIAEAHGGTVIADSEGSAKGSVFQLRLPNNTPPEMRANPTASDGTDANHCTEAVRVLLVEDNDGSREMLKGFLGLEGYNVEAAQNGSEGIEKFRSFKPELCVIDIGLPDLNGFEVAVQIRKMQRDVILIALTGYGQDSDRVKVKNAGFDLHLVKPVDPENLSTLLVELRANKIG